MTLPAHPWPLPPESYRYTLERSMLDLLGGPRGVLLFVLLNPSTATADVDDQTVRKVKAQTRLWGFNVARVVNLYAFRATKPADLWQAHVRNLDVVGPENDATILREAQRADAIACGWGRLINHATERARQVLELLWQTQHAQLMCMGRNGDGSPVHPVFARYVSQPVVWKVRKAAA